VRVRAYVCARACVRMCACVHDLCVCVYVCVLRVCVCMWARALIDSMHRIIYIGTAYLSLSISEVRIERKRLYLDLRPTVPQLYRTGTIRAYFTTWCSP